MFFGITCTMSKLVRFMVAMQTYTKEGLLILLINLFSMCIKLIQNTTKNHNNTCKLNMSNVI